jgi:antitoxin (DNA-binding transcriptional repressor) of toxin-antitoxin stability system
MSDTQITVTEAARNFADCVNRVHYQGTTFVLLKNGVPFARLVPAGSPVVRGAELAEALSQARLSSASARSWYRELRRARTRLKPVTDKWQ